VSIMWEYITSKLKIPDISIDDIFRGIYNMKI
jgi:hypothetical protein